MGILRSTGKVAGHIVNVRVDKWFDADGRKESAKKTLHYTKELFHVQQPEHEETFEEALERLGLTEADLAESEKSHHRNVVIFAIMAMAIFTYSVYLATQGNFGGFFVGLAVTGFSIVQVFRNHFWLYQIRHKKLGCNFSEWLNSAHQDRDQESGQ